MSNPIIELNNIDVSLGGKKVLSNITWQLCTERTLGVYWMQWCGEINVIKIDIR